MKFERSPKPPSPRTQNHDNHQASSDSHDCHWQLPPTGLTSGQRIPGPSCSAAFLLAHTDRSTKVTVPGPFTMSQQAQNDQYPTRTSVGPRRCPQRGNNRPLRYRCRRRADRRALYAVLRRRRQGIQGGSHQPVTRECYRHNGSAHLFRLRPLHQDQDGDARGHRRGPTRRQRRRRS